MLSKAKSRSAGQNEMRKSACGGKSPMNRGKNQSDLAARLTGLWIVMLLVLGLSGYAGAQTDPIDQALADTEHDFGLISQWWCEQLSEGLAFSAGSGVNLPAYVCHFLGFEVGATLGTGISLVDTDAFKELGTKTINTSQMEMLPLLPIPAATIHAKLGLPFKIDVGLKYGMIPSFKVSVEPISAEIENTIIGLEVRKKLPVPIIPVTVYANYAYASGLLVLAYEETKERTEMYSEPGIGTVEFTQTMKREFNWKTDWGVSTIGAGAVVSKKLLFFTPFAGIGVSKNLGEVNSDLGAGVTITLEPKVAGVGTADSESMDITGTKGTDPAKDVNIRLIGGFELSFLMLKIGIAGEVAGTDKFAVNAGLRLQF